MRNEQTIFFEWFRASRDLEIKNFEWLRVWKRWDDVLASVKVHTVNRTYFPLFCVLLRFERNLFFLLLIEAMSSIRTYRPITAYTPILLILLCSHYSYTSITPYMLIMKCLSIMYVGGFQFSGNWNKTSSEILSVSLWPRNIHHK